MQTGGCAGSLSGRFGITVVATSGGVAAAALSHSPAAVESLMQDAQSAFDRGLFAEALDAWKSAARQYGDTGQPEGQSRALVQASQAAQALGQTKDALDLLEVALALANRLGQPAWTAQVLDRLGRVYLSLRKFEASAQFLQEAKALADSTGNPTVRAAVENDLCVLHAVEKRYTEAQNTCRHGVELADRAGIELLAIRVRLNAARIALQTAHPNEAEAYFNEATERISALATSYDKASLLITLGTGLAELGRMRGEGTHPHAQLILQAANLLQEAAGLAESQGDHRMASYAWGHLGRLYESEHRYDEAAELTRKAVFYAQAVSAPESLYRWQWQMGRILASLNRLDEALASYRNAVYTLEPIRPEVALSAEHSDLGASDSLRPLYVEYADLLLHRAARMDDDEFAQGYLKAARDAVEASKAIELRDYFKDECIDALHTQKQVETISPTTIVIYPIVFSDRMELLVSMQGQLTRVAVNVTATKLNEEVHRFRHMLEKRTSREYLPHAQKLYDWLVRPLEQVLASGEIDTLVIVPDGSLRTIPMAALHDGSQFLIAKYAVATTPGLFLTDPHPFERTQVTLLASGLTEGTQGFPPLPHVKAELTKVRSFYGGDQLMNSKFLTARLEQELRDHPISVLHIASHGRFEKEVGRSFVLTYDDKLTMERLDEYVGLLKFRKEPLELLTLSACETAAGDDRAALGLAGVAIKAGARSALATLWSINDDASSKLVVEFYRQLHDRRVSKATALQRAQLTIMAEIGYEHPAYWSPFLILNNWL